MSKKVLVGLGVTVAVLGMLAYVGYKALLDDEDLGVDYEDMYGMGFGDADKYKGTILSDRL